jgi:hypothetical protein
MQTVSIKKSKINQSGGLVILSLKEYQRLQESAVPTYYLKGKAATDLDKLVDQGLMAHQKGKTNIMHSLADLD